MKDFDINRFLVMNKYIFEKLFEGMKEGGRVHTVQHILMQRSKTPFHCSICLRDEGHVGASTHQTQQRMASTWDSRALVMLERILGKHVAVRCQDVCTEYPRLHVNRNIRGIFLYKPREHRFL